MVSLQNSGWAAEYTLVKDLNESVQFIHESIMCREEESTYYTIPRQPQGAPQQKVLIYKEDAAQLPYEEQVCRDEEMVYQQEPLEEKVFVVDRRRRIQRTTEWPYRFFGLLSMYFPDGKKSAGSCVLVGPHHILTCAHNVYDRSKGAWVENIKVYFALNELCAPYGEATGVRIYLDNRYLDKTNTYYKDYDIAFVVINYSIGNEIGWSGLMYLPNKKFENKKIAITGYPGDKPKQMWTYAYL